MAQKVNVAWYIGDQELAPGHFEPLFNISVKEGLRDALKHITYTEGSTITGKTLKRIVPNVFWPSKLVPHRNTAVPPPPESIAFTYV